MMNNQFAMLSRIILLKVEIKIVLVKPNVTQHPVLEVLCVYKLISSRIVAQMREMVNDLLLVHIAVIKSIRDVIKKNYHTHTHLLKLQYVHVDAVFDLYHTLTCKGFIFLPKHESNH